MVHWARLAEAGRSEFPVFAAEFFALVGLPPPSRQQCSTALAEIGEIEQRSEVELDSIRARHAARRRALVDACQGPRQIRLMISSFAEQAWNMARGMGWEVDGEAAVWRELARARPPTPRSPLRGARASRLGAHTGRRGSKRTRTRTSP